eukprot:37023_1
MWSVLLGLLFSTASSYILVEQEKIWAEAEEYCQLEYGSHLATIRNDEDAKELFNMIVPGAPYGEVWIGLNDLDTEGHWVYTDGTGCPTADDSCGRNVFKYWNTDPQPNVQPNGGTDQNCAQIVTDDTYWTINDVTWDSMLNDWQCVSTKLDTNLYFVWVFACVYHIEVCQKQIHIKRTMCGGGTRLR